MTDIDAVEERLRAVERAVADGDGELSDPTGELEARIDELESTTAELESGLQAVRGYVGQVKSVDDEIEQRADAAAAAVDDVEDRVAALERRLDGEDAEPSGSESVPDLDQRRHDKNHQEQQRDGDRFPARGNRQSRDSTPATDRRRERRATQRRPDEPASQDTLSEAHRRPADAASRPARTRPRTEPGVHDQNSGCPHCGAVAMETGGNEPERTPQRNRAADGSDSSDGDSDPVDDVDEQSVVARLRDAL